MERSVYKAAIRGDVTLLQELLQQDNKILDGATYDSISKENPLHVAARFGHLDFVKEIVSRKPEYACELNSKGLSPLYLASEKGHIEVVKVLLEKNTDVCLVGDSQGRTPLHIAAMKGRVEVLKELFPVESTAAWVLTDEGEPILHLCANHNQFESIKTLIELANDNEFLNLKDSDDNTILHVLAPKNRTEIIKFLLSKTGVEINALNVNTCTALDVLVQAAKRGSDYKKIKRILHRAAAKRAKDLSNTQLTPRRKNTWKAHNNWLNETKSIVMVIAILIATVTFQAVLNPPGGVWQDDNGSHSAGKAVMSYKNRTAYVLISICNQIGFFASVSIILLLISGFNVKRRSLMWALMISMWIAIGSMVVSFTVALTVLTHNGVYVGSVTWFYLVGILMVAHIIRLVVYFVKKLRTLRNQRREGLP